MRFLDILFFLYRLLRSTLALVSAAVALTLVAIPALASNQVILGFDRSGVQIALVDEDGDELGTQSLTRKGALSFRCSTENSGLNILNISGSSVSKDLEVCVFPRFQSIGLSGSVTAGRVGVGQTLSISPGNEDQEFFSASLNLRVKHRNAIVEVIARNGDDEKVIEVRTGRYQNDPVPETVDEVVLCQRFRDCLVEISADDGERIESISMTATAGPKNKRIGVFSLSNSTFDVPSFEPENPILDIACGENDFMVTTQDGAELTITRQNQTGDTGCSEVDQLPLDLGIIEELIDNNSYQTQYFQTDNLGTNPVFFLDLLWRAEIITFVEQAAILFDDVATQPTNAGQLQFSVQGHNSITLGEALLQDPPEIFLLDQCPVGSIIYDDGIPISFDASGLDPVGDDMSTLKNTLDFGCYYEQEVERVDDAVCESLYPDETPLQANEGCAVIRQGVAVIGDWFTSRNLR